MAAWPKISRGGIFEKFSARGGYTKNTPLPPYSRCLLVSIVTNFNIILHLDQAWPRGESAETPCRRKFWETPLSGDIKNWTPWPPLGSRYLGQVWFRYYYIKLRKIIFYLIECFRSYASIVEWNTNVILSLVKIKLSKTSSLSWLKPKNPWNIPEKLGKFTKRTSKSLKNL